MYRGLEKDIIIERPIFIYQWTLTVHSHWCSRICRHHTHLCRIITVESKAKGLHIKAEFDTLQQLYLPQFTFRELLLKNLRAYTKHTQIKAIHCVFPLGEGLLNKTFVCPSSLTSRCTGSDKHTLLFEGCLWTDRCVRLNTARLSNVLHQNPQ